MTKTLSQPTIVSVAIVITLFAVCLLVARAEETAAKAKPADSTVTSALEKAKEKLAPAYTLAYKFTPGEDARTKVVHLVTVETKIKGSTQTAKTRSVSTKTWRIKSIDKDGNFVFEHLVDSVEMWSSVSGRQEVRYDSTSGEKPPAGYEHVASSIGKVLAVVTMTPHGRVLSRTDSQPQFNPGIGELTIPFPDQPIKPGVTWSIPDEIKIRLDDGTLKRVQTRQQYKLQKVEAGVATISVQTQVLTPVSEPKIQAELVQRLQHGTIKFDLEAGRLIHKQLDMDEEVFGFNGADSHMQYLARFTEEPADAAAATEAEVAKPAEQTAAAETAAENLRK
jgi:hypothetical protein